MSLLSQTSPTQGLFEQKFIELFFTLKKAQKMEFRNLVTKAAMEQALEELNQMKWLGPKCHDKREKAAWIDCLKLYQSTVLQLNQTLDKSTKHTDFDASGSSRINNGFNSSSSSQPNNPIKLSFNSRGSRGWRRRLMKWRARLCESSGSEYSPPETTVDLSDLVKSFMERESGEERERMRRVMERMDLRERRINSRGFARDFDAQTWLSTALTFLDTCQNGFIELNVTKNIFPLMSNNDALMISNSLAINNSTTEQQDYKEGFPRWVSSGDRRLLWSELPIPDLVVAQDGSGDFCAIKEALDALMNMNHSGRFVICVERGVYNECIEIELDMLNIMLVGDDWKNTIITGNRSHVGCFSTFDSSTVRIHELRDLLRPGLERVLSYPRDPRHLDSKGFGSMNLEIQSTWLRMDSNAI
ncbi:hypothetical protein HYC85_001068 [Camellia sinensis]|uniref:Pectinesterase n=1 Tax=Camellia sinensis TaxID=4442 RepID=A0A7J7I4L0_CAMSI|nr:hypothetical protein HYC85_001068 [Camellia sinensis]